MSDAVEAATLAILSQLNNGVDKSRCGNLFGAAADQSLVATTSFQSILSITGKGYANFIYVKCPTSPRNFTLQIIIDGVTMLDATINATGSSYGFYAFDRRLLVTSWDGGVMSTFAPGNNWRSVTLGASLPAATAIPFSSATATAGNFFQLYSESIFFKSSLLVQVKTSTGTDTVTFGFGGAYY